MVLKRGFFIIINYRSKQWNLRNWFQFKITENFQSLLITLHGLSNVLSLLAHSEQELALVLDQAQQVVVFQNFVRNVVQDVLDQSLQVDQEVVVVGEALADEREIQLVLGLFRRGEEVEQQEIREF